MKTNYYALLLLSIGSVLLWAQCDTPGFENIDHPFEVGLNDTVAIPITVIRGAFPMLNDSLLTPELEKVIKLYQEDIVPLISSREGAYHLWLGIQLPENWSIINNFDYVAYDSLPAMNIDSGTFVYSQEHIDLLNTEWSYTLDSGNKWMAWKSADPIEFDYGKMWTNPRIITDDTPGYFNLSYLLGYDNNSPCAQINNNLTIASAMMDTTWVTNTCDAGDGSLRRATLNVRSNGLVLFSLDAEDTIHLSSTIPIYKSMQINNNLSEDLVNIKGPGSGNIFNIDHSILLQYYYSNISLYNLNLFGAGNEAIYVTNNRYFNLYNSSIHHNEGSGLILNGIYNDEYQFYYNIGNCEIFDNNGENGGGVNVSNYNGSIDNTKLYNNSALRGGGMYLNYCQNTNLYNCEIYNNNAENGGGCYIGSESNVDLENTCIKTNSASQKGGGCYIEENSNSNLTFLTYSPRCNIFLNQSPEGNDLFSYIPLSVVVDTFTVMNPTNFHATPIENFTFDILHAALEQVPDDLFVSPDGDNHNSGITAEEPLKNFYYAFAKTMADTNNQQTIHLIDGTYSPSGSGELFPLILPDFVNLVGISGSSTILDAEGTADVLMINNNSSNLISGITITGGNTFGNGGGIYCLESDPLIQDVTITGNQATGYGGGIYCYGSNPIIEDVTISDNQASMDGGGIYCLESDPLIQDVTITGNQATGSGGGLYCEYSEPILLNICLAGNSALNGGGMTIYNAYPTEINNLKITGNSASQSGGGIFFDYTGNLDIKNTTISNNTAKTGGGICFGNRVSGQLFSDTNRCNIYFNQAESGNELFTGWQQTYIRLDTFSVMHPGDYYATPFQKFNFDIWNAKLEQVEADMYVSPDGDNNNNGLSADEPLKNLHNAIMLIRADYDHQHTVYLMDGTYSPSTNYDIFPISIPSCLNLSGTSSEAVILDAEGLSSVFTFTNTIKNRISDMTLTGGSALNGGGIYSYKSSPVLQNLVLIGNNAENCGGALYFERDVPSILNTSVLNNSSKNGGGIYLKWSNASITNVKIQGNIAAVNGGAFYFDASHPKIINSLISKNSSNFSGGALYLDDYSQPGLINVTIANNFAGEYGGGIYCEYSCKPLLYNSIMWNDVPQEINFGNVTSNSSISIFYSNIQGGEDGIITGENGIVYWEEGSIDQDPEFIEFSNDDNEYTLTAFSPCIEAGRPDTTGLYLPEYDLADNYRLWDGDNDGEAIIDMGAFEFASHPVDVIPYDETTFVDFQCFPNPLINSSQITFELDETKMVRIEVYNLLGEQVEIIHQSVLPQGKHNISWNAQDLANGFYMVQFQAGNSQTTQKLLKQ